MDKHCEFLYLEPSGLSVKFEVDCGNMSVFIQIFLTWLDILVFLVTYLFKIVERLLGDISHT